MTKTTNRILAIAAALLAAGVSAQAADIDVAPAAYDWSGFYIGGQGGYAFGDADHSFSNGAPDGDSKPDGFFGGLHAGYNAQINSIVLGLEVDAELAGIDGTFQEPAAATSSGSTDIKAQGSLRGRVGLAYDRLLPYLTGGLALADVDYGGGPLGGPCCGYSKSPLGYTIGAGIEYALTDMVSTRLEYRYTDFGTKRGGLAPTFPGVTMPVDLETHAVRLGLSIHF